MSQPPEVAGSDSQQHLIRSDLDFPVVGIGASAGGLKALMTLFSHMPADSGMAFVVIMHLSPSHESSADRILQGVTKVPVLQVTKPVPIERNKIYVIPPAMDLLMNDGYLRLLKPQRSRGPQVAIDLFFRTLAEVHHTHSIGVVLSGSGSDGSVGLARIKEFGGVTVAQLPEDAEFESMPRSAIESGAVDIVLPVADMPQRLMELGANLKRVQIPLPDAPEETQPSNDASLVKASENALREILAILRTRTGHDFKHYKQATVLRRIERRLQVNALSNMPAYASFLAEKTEETPALLGDMLIGVTNFFRDRDAFDALERDIIPSLFERAAVEGEDTSVRVWSVACSTGEEAYSLSMLLSEHAELHNSNSELHVFATDIDEQALEVGRASVYPDAIVTDVAPSRLRQFFTKEANHYRVKKEIREKILFARHNILRDPPFSRLDLISCRNLLIYLDRDIQKEVLRMFHFALKPGGFLFLGSSETADACSHLFTPVDKKNRIYRARETSTKRPPMPINDFISMPMRGPIRTAEPSGKRMSFADIHQRVLEQYAPPSVIVNHESDIVHMSSGAGRFLRYVGGEPTLHLPTVVHPELRLELRTALYQAIKTGKSVEARRVRMQQEGRTTYINMVAKPFRDNEASSDYVLVLFDEVEDSLDTSIDEEGGSAKDNVLTHLEAELQQTKEQLQLTMEHSDSSTEELKASNEELQAINEELRSATEELETSKEELQSINEELITVNAELKVKVEETSKINDDLQNLITSTDIATVFVDRKMRIKWFTPRASDIFNVIGVDAGRSILDITHRLDYPDLASDASLAFEDLRLVEREVSSSSDHWYLARFLPYRTIDDRIEGAVLTFIDITARRRAEERVRVGETHMKLLAKSIVDYAIITLDCEGVISTWNSGAEKLFALSAEEAIGQPVEVLYTADDIRQGSAAQDRQQALLENLAAGERWFKRKDGSRVCCHSLINPMLDEQNLHGYAMIVHDLTEQQRKQQENQNMLAHAQTSNTRKDEYFAVLSHELKHPLNLIQLNVDLLLRTPVARASSVVGKATQAIQTAVRSQSRIIDDLMDISRIRTGKLQLSFSVLELHTVLETIISVFKPLADAANVTFEHVIPDETMFVNVDATRLEQIIWNLLNNALKFTPEGERISLLVVRQGDQVRLNVVDTGQGIDAAFLVKIFDMFGQAELQHAQRSKNGLGIGLALAKQLAEAQGGAIEAYSEGIGRGSRFSLLLPICLQTELELQTLASESAKGGVLQGLSVLLVDDSPDITNVMQLLLESEDASVTTAGNGAEGLALTTKMQYDLILSDIGMPVMDGHEMMRNIRAQADNPNVTTPSVALTGYSTLKDVEDAKAAGFTEHLNKPINMDTLLDALNSVLQR